MIFLEKFTTACKKICGDNLCCVLLIGSVQKRDQTPFSDYDLIVITRTMKIEDFRQLRGWLRTAEDFIDLSLLSLDELPSDPNDFRLGSHGCYQLELILKYAKCLYGKNSLLEFGRPTDDAIRSSIFAKIVEYTWWTRRMFVESNRERSLASNYQLNSRIIKMVRDILYLTNMQSIDTKATTIVQMLLKQYPALLSEEESNILQIIVDKKQANACVTNMSDDYFERRLSIVNKLHKKATELYYSL